MTAKKNRAGSCFVKALLILLETILLLGAAVYVLAYSIYHGPSQTFRDMLVRSLNETSAAYFVNELFLSKQEIESIVHPAGDNSYVETDTSLVTINVKPEDDQAMQGTDESAVQTDAWGLSDEDGDGLILCPVKGEGYSGYMLVVLDPSRVIMGCVPSDFGRQGYTVEQMVKYYDAVAGINGGSFYDPDGQGDGSTPYSMVVFDGEIYYSERGSGGGFAGLDSNHVLHVGRNMSCEDVKNADIRFGISFGPVLIANGIAVDPDTLMSGLNPRTAIGQRPDGAILMLVIDGRQALSIGASFKDLQSVMLRFGAVNACNLDGGSSSMLWLNGEYVNNCASVIGIRPIPTTFLVLKQGVKLYD